MTALASPLEISCKLHHQQPLSPFRRHGAAPRDYDSSRKGQVVSCDQLPAIANCPGYTRAFQGLTKTEFVNLMRHPEQGEFPYDPSGYSGSRGDHSGDRGTGNHPHADYDRDAQLADRRNYAISHSRRRTQRSQHSSREVAAASSSKRVEGL